MPNVLAHFAIEADDVERARAFYELAFGWRFEAWGPPGFYLIHDAGVHGALQQRSGSNEPGRHGFECTFAVADLETAVTAIEGAGGTLIGERITIPTVGRLMQFADTEGNRAIVMQYEAERAAEMGLPDPG